MNEYKNDILDVLERKIVENGTVTIDSIFRFEDNTANFPAFLAMAHKKNCTVSFENEGYIFKPTPDDKILESIKIVSLFVYIDMGKELFGKRIKYLTELMKNEEWAQGESGPILKAD